MNILITGGTGFIGRGLCPVLLREGHYLRIITRYPGKHSDEEAKNRQFISWESKLTESAEWADAVINLAGESIFGQRWTDEVKEEIYSSRISTTHNLVEAIKNARQPPEVMISGSAVGYYGNRESDILDEQEPPGDDFLAELCVDWEKTAAPVKKTGVRLVISRTGIVLEKGGGVLKQMLPPFRFFAGGPVGRGTQFIPWIHRYDLCRIFNFFLTNNEAEGAYNVCAPYPVTMNAFAESMGAVLNRPAFFRVPEWLLKAVLGEAAEPVAESLRARPERLEEQEYRFNYPRVKEALAEILQ